jgi:hypothetical protein
MAASRLLSSRSGAPRAESGNARPDLGKDRDLASTVRARHVGGSAGLTLLPERSQSYDEDGGGTSWSRMSLVRWWTRGAAVAAPRKVPEEKA